MTLAPPVVFLVLMIVLPIVRGIASEDEGEARPGANGIVDLSGIVDSNLAQEADLRSYSDTESGERSLLDGEISMLFIIPQDYLATGKVEWRFTKTSLSAGVSGQGARNAVQRLLQESLVTGSLESPTKERFLAPASFTSIVVDEDGTTKEGAGEADLLSVSYIFGVMLMVSIFTGSGFLLESVSDEKQNRMIEILLTSVSPMVIMSGKVLAMGGMGLLQITVWATSLTLLGPRILDNFPDIGRLSIDVTLLVWLIAFFVTGYFVVAVIMAGLGAAASSYRESSQLSALVILPSIVPMWLFQVIAGNPDGAIARFLSYVPITAPLTMMLRMGAADVSIIEIVSSLAATILGGLAFLWVAARVFRAGLLLYGQRMGIGRVFQALRQAG